VKDAVDDWRAKMPNRADTKLLPAKSISISCMGSNAHFWFHVVN